MTLPFAKYQGAGNDFILVDDRAGEFPKERAIIERLCDRKLGIGADGLILLQKGEEQPYFMRIFNCDGGEAGMCGNGIRCLFALLEREGLTAERCTIETPVGPHEVWRQGERIHVRFPKAEILSLEMPMRSYRGALVYTGVLHYVLLQQPNTSWSGLVDASSDTFPEGINLNQAHWDKEKQELNIKTHERGVGEVHACGTGVVASALVAKEILKLQGAIRVRPNARELLEVEQKEGGVELSGPALFVFQGEIDLYKTP